MADHERFNPEFIADLSIALDYYDSISTSTGIRFRKRINERLDLVLDAPKGFAIVCETFRAVRVKSYPYVIIYEVTSGEVEFLGLIHGAGEQQNWFERFIKPK